MTQWHLLPGKETQPKTKHQQSRRVFSFVHSFVPDISIAPLQVHYCSEVLPTTARILCRSYHAEALQTTVGEGLAQGPYVEWDSNLRPSGPKAPNLPLSHHAPQFNLTIPRNMSS